MSGWSTCAVGLTVIVIRKGSPWQSSVVIGVTSYTKFCGVFEVLINIDPGIVEAASELLAPPEMFEDDVSSISQVYVVPNGTTPWVPSSGVISVKAAVSSHIVWVKLSICGSGLTTTWTVKGFPSQPVDVTDGITV